MMSFAFRLQLLLLSIAALFGGCEPIALNGCSSKPEQEESASVKQEQPQTKSDPLLNDLFDDITAVPLSIPDFAQFTIKQKKALYYLAEAEKTVNTLRLTTTDTAGIRLNNVLQAVSDVSSKVPSEIMFKIKQYSDSFFLNNGPNDAWTFERIRPSFIPGEFAAAAQIALTEGNDLGLDTVAEKELGYNQLERLDRFLVSLRPVLFGSIKDTESKEEKESSQNMAAVFTQQKVSVLKKISVLLSMNDSSSINALSSFLLTKDIVEYTKYIEHMNKPGVLCELALSPKSVDFLAEDTKLTEQFHVIAVCIDEDSSLSVKKAANEVAYYERTLPGNAMFIRPRKNISPPNVQAYFVVSTPPWSEVVDQGALTYGNRFTTTKTMLFLNAALSREKTIGEALARAFSFDDETLALRLKWREAALSAFLILKYAVGYQAGTRKSGTSAAISDFGSSPLRNVLSEIHSDLAALHFAFDQKSVELGLIPEPECADALLLIYVSRILEEALQSGNPNIGSGAQVVARRIVFRGLQESGVIAVKRHNEHYYVQILDYGAARNHIASRLGDLQRMISLDLLNETQTLIDKDGGPLPNAWQKDVESVMQRIGVKNKTAYLSPVLNAQIDENDNIVDVTVTLPSTISEWAAAKRSAK